MNERFIRIRAGETELSAILHSGNEQNNGTIDCGVLLIVGGPQYRVGSHRQFVKLSRHLATHNIPSMRFDTSGMGDSGGNKTAFYQQNNDIALAITAFFQQCPQLNQVVLWGLCDAASAALLYCYQQPDSRVAGLILLNPWVRQQQSYAKVMLKHYYWQRLSSKSFWQKLFAGGLNPLQSLKELVSTVKQSRKAQQPGLTPSDPAKQQLKNKKSQTTADNYVQQMLAGWQEFSGNSLVITSGNDHTAQEFLQLCARDNAWAACLAGAQHQHIAAANHTFASAEWRGQVEQLSYLFIKAALQVPVYPTSIDKAEE